MIRMDLEAVLSCSVVAVRLSSDSELENEEEDGIDDGASRMRSTTISSVFSLKIKDLVRPPIFQINFGSTNDHKPQLTHQSQNRLTLPLP